MVKANKTRNVHYNIISSLVVSFIGGEDISNRIITAAQK